ncbi:hypothetical protein HKD37_18G049955 [Glycine soja]
MGKIKGSVRSGLESTRCSKKWHREPFKSWVNWYKTSSRGKKIPEMMEEGCASKRPPMFKGMLRRMKSLGTNGQMVICPIFFLNLRARNALLCAPSQEENSKVHNFRSTKQMWDTLAITYEGSFEVKCNKLSLLTHNNELFSMKGGQDIKTMFGRLQTLLNELRSLDHRLQHKELLGIPKVYEQELAQDEGTKKRKLLALTVQRSKHNFASKESSSKVFTVNDASEEESNDDDSDEEGGKFIQKSFHKKEKSPIICYKYKKPGHFESKCSDLENSKDKNKKKFLKSKKKSLIRTWEDLDNSSSNEDNEEEANLFFMVDASTSKVEQTLNTSSKYEDPQPDDTINSDGEEVIFESREDLIKGYNQLFSTPTHISKAYRKLNKCFQHLEREHEDLKKVYQVNLVDFVLENTLPSIVQDVSVCEEVKALLSDKMSSNLNYKLKGCEVLKELPPKIQNSMRR